MRVCFIAEGCYPYEVGGVSSWIHSLIQSFPDIEFSLVAIIANRSISKKFKYTLPDNLVSVHEVYLNDCNWSGGKKDKSSVNLHLQKKQEEALESLVAGVDVDWDTLFSIFKKGNLSIDKLLMSPLFLEVVIKFYRQRYSRVQFTDFLWTMRSIYITLFQALEFRPPEADIYHCVATGYAGIIGSMAKYLYPKSKLLLTEHGIYTREREEEIIAAKWVTGIFKDIWIAQFRKMSNCCYAYADRVTSLFKQAKQLQIEIGCDEKKIMVVPNGINTELFANSPPKDPDDHLFNIGAVLRVAPIKDVKTMITAFYHAWLRNNNIKLWIMGSYDENPEYYKECCDLIEMFGAQNIVFTGVIKTADYMGKMDATILTSISEGQPLTILESFAAGKPVIATNVGNCQGLIYGEYDDFGDAGIVVPVMSTADITKAILNLAEHPEKCRGMGQVGRKRVLARYKIEDMKATFGDIYKKLYEADRS